MTEREAYDEICCYTLLKGDGAFIHQHVVDAFAAQNVTAEDKAIKVTFALVGLYLHLERGFTGRDVQKAHMKLARDKRDWPKFDLPGFRGKITALDVFDTFPGITRDKMIDEWCRSVWHEFRGSRDDLIDLLTVAQII